MFGTEGLMKLVSTLLCFRCRAQRDRERVIDLFPTVDCDSSSVSYVRVCSRQHVCVRASVCISKRLFLRVSFAVSFGPILFPSFSWVCGIGLLLAHVSVFRQAVLPPGECMLAILRVRAQHFL